MDKEKEVKEMAVILRSENERTGKLLHERILESINSGKGYSSFAHHDEFMRDMFEGMASALVSAGYGNVAEAKREAVKEFAAKASSILDELEPLSIQQRKIALLQIAAEFGVTEVGK